ncbi:PP2C family protein-serine/threonine phosphatase [Nonomuraea ferruginea]|uniref:PP2C family protein-serine/threonine phosphatase n=2 Tax=Nonomuraea ferruginea TaxID=46174 RepID=A0ABT4SPY8_9ACTN|nr:PP2C family protein-serine/threonine phosphatase [Nonomuraea ferruginea]MDA0639078.1 PP2C family protein-serine/threonine phosphatase [Nonomuraea ferruginea]
MLGGLLEASQLAAMEDLPGLVAEYGRLTGFSQTVIYVADLQQRMLVPLAGRHDVFREPLEPIRIDATMAGRAFRSVEIVQARHMLDPAAPETVRASPAGHGPHRMWVPLLNGTERIGVLEVTVPQGSEGVALLAGRLALLVSLLLISKGPHSDSYTRLVRAQPMTLSAEVLWNLLPPRTFADDRVVVSAALEPIYEVGGDAYDYAIDGDTLHVSIFDAMGHDAAAGLTATIAMGSARTSRRQGKDLPATSEAIDAVIAEQFTGRFATGVLADLDLRTGRLTWVNRGHHPPLVIRGGQQVATLSGVPDPPMGFGLGLSTGLLRYQLEPGDRLLFYTDGIIEAQSPDGQVFGLERFIDFIVRREADGMSAPETLRRLIQTILERQRGRLQDDATVLMVEWRTKRQQHLILENARVPVPQEAT